MAYRKSARSRRSSARSYSPRQRRGGARTFAKRSRSAVRRGGSSHTLRLVIAPQPDAAASPFVTPGLRPGLVASPKDDPRGGRSRF